MLALTAATAVAMFFPPVIDSTGDSTVVRPRIAIPVQLQFGLIMLAHLLAFSLARRRATHPLFIACVSAGNHDRHVNAASPHQPMGMARGLDGHRLCAGAIF